MCKTPTLPRDAKAAGAGDSNSSKSDSAAAPPRLGLLHTLLTRRRSTRVPAAGNNNSGDDDARRQQQQQQQLLLLRELERERGRERERATLRHVYELHVFRRVVAEVQSASLAANFRKRVSAQFKRAHASALRSTGSTSALAHSAASADADERQAAAARASARARSRWRRAVRFVRMAKSVGHGLEIRRRHHEVHAHFPGALDMDDYMLRVEAALYRHGFNEENSIAMTAFCRDEACDSLQHAVEVVFGDSFHTNGLGGVLTCGKTGFKAFMSHSPIASDRARERYIFVAFPHIGISATDEVGVISRPNRAGESHACGALIAALQAMKKNGAEQMATQPQDSLDPEYSIMCQRLARHTLDAERENKALVDELDLVAFTKIAEEVYRRDLMELVEATIDTSKADCAVLTGVHIHNWGLEYHGDEPHLEFIWPRVCYAVVDGKGHEIDLNVVDPPTPRQLEVLGEAIEKAARSGKEHNPNEVAFGAYSAIELVSPKEAIRSARKTICQPAEAEAKKPATPVRCGCFSAPLFSA